MVERIGEPVDVMVAFYQGRAMPRLFSWRQRRYEVKEVTAHWSDYEGEAKQHYFSVETDGANLYELVFNTYTLAWRLVKIYHT